MVTRRTVHGCFIPVASVVVVATVHVLNGGVVVMACCFVHAIATCVVAVTMRPAITATGCTGVCVGVGAAGGNGGDSGVGVGNGDSQSCRHVHHQVRLGWQSWFRDNAGWLFRSASGS